MRPFKFFFAASLGIILFFFVARFVIMALLFAAVLSTVFFLSRKIKYFFQRLNWEENDYHDSPFQYNNYRSVGGRPKWKNGLLMDYPARRQSFRTNSKVIQIL